MTSRESRGQESQQALADHLRAHGFPKAASAGHRPGRDILGTPGLCMEVKSRRDFNPLEWLRQAAAATHRDVPLVICRPDGYGPASIEQWPLIVRLADALTIIRDAGYGDPRF